MTSKPQDPATPEMRELARLKKWAVWLDAAVEIPWIRQWIGLEALIGLIPVVGDFGAAALSLVIVIRALRFGIPPRMVFAMCANILVDALIGSIPVAGDLFDLWFKANIRNVAMLEEYLRSVDRAESLALD